jgi:NTE family protein
VSSLPIRFGTLLLVTASIIAIVPLAAQTTIQYRPTFESKPFSGIHQIYPFKVQKHPRIGLVLSGGGARGTAQIGVLKAFEAFGVPIDFISATSMGAVIGGLYASGYTSTEIESLALTTKWDEVLSLNDESNRTDLAIDQKLAADWSFLVVRFQGLQPVIPHAVSSGQRLTNFLSEETLQALYHPNPSFDDLKIPFRAVTTDLITGQRIILSKGSLAKAIRASSTVPLLFNPIEQDSLRLIDGGLLLNIPVDVAREESCDLVVAVNSTSGLRRSEELNAPWQTADQIMGIMMQLSNQAQLRRADISITPPVGRHSSSDFTGLDSLIRTGFASASQEMDSIRQLYSKAVLKMDNDADHFEVFPDPHVEFMGEGAPDSLILKIRNEAFAGSLSSIQIRKHIRWLYNAGTLSDVIVEVQPETKPVRIVYNIFPNPRISNVEFSGNHLIATEELAKEFTTLLGKPLNPLRSNAALENILRLYRKKGYSLARIGNSSFDSLSGALRLDINEGIIDKIDIQGDERAEDSFVLREFAIREGEVFAIERAKRGLTDLISTKVFEYVYLDVSYVQGKPILAIRLSELPSQLIRIGIRADDERKLQGMIDIRDENFRGIGTELGLSIAGGVRNGLVNLEFKSNRLFSSIFTFNLSGFASAFNSYTYADDPNETRGGRWARARIGEYSDVRVGGRLVVGGQFERFGNATVEWSLQNSRIQSIENAGSLRERYTLSLVKFGTMVDTRNDYPFPTSGIHMKLSYEFASKTFLSDVGYNALRFMYESYRTWGERSTFRPRLTVGIADATMPLGQQFRFGGSQSMFGTREDDRRGRQLFALNMEYRYKSPIRIGFDTYLRLRYDLGSISAFPEQIKFSSFRHGIGAELALDTPVGSAVVGAGKSFFFDQDLPDHPLQQGPILFYFVLGYEL